LLQTQKAPRLCLWHAKDAALQAMADALEARAAEVLAANASDIAAGRAGGMTDALVDAELLSRALVTGGDAALASYQRDRDTRTLEFFEKHLR